MSGGMFFRFMPYSLRVSLYLMPLLSENHSLDGTHLLFGLDCLALKSRIRY